MLFSRKSLRHGVSVRLGERERPSMQMKKKFKSKQFIIGQPKNVSSLEKDVFFAPAYLLGMAELTQVCCCGSKSFLFLHSQRFKYGKWQL
jgi:hypothetical protein